MKTYQDMLRGILKSSGWSQQQLAVNLGVSFPTVNYWLNNKVTPRAKMQKRIRDLYIARDISYEGPVYITLLFDDTQLKPGDEIALIKTSEDKSGHYEIFGIKREDPIQEVPEPPPSNSSIRVANTADAVAKGTKPAFRIYDRIYVGAYARVMFTLNNSAIAVIEDWGLEIDEEP